MFNIALLFLKDHWKGALVVLVLAVLLGANAVKSNRIEALQKQVSTLTATNAKLTLDHAADQRQLKDLSKASDKLRADLSTAESKASEIRVVTQTRVVKILSKPLPVVPVECIQKVQPVADAARTKLNDIWSTR